MRDISAKICRANRNTFYIQNFFPEIVPYMRQLGKIWYSQRGYTEDDIALGRKDEYCVPDN